MINRKWFQYLGLFAVVIGVLLLSFPWVRSASQSTPTPVSILPTHTPTYTPTPTSTDTPTPTPTGVPSSTNTPTLTPPATPTPSAVPSAVDNQDITPTQTATLTPSHTPTLTPPTSTPILPKPCFDTRFQHIEDTGGAIQEVRGYVYDMNRQPLRNAVVEIYVKRLWERYHRQTNTTDDGGFAFIGLGGNTNNEYILRVVGMPDSATAYNTWEKTYTFKFNTTHDLAVVFIYQIPFRTYLCHPPAEFQ